MSVLDLTRHMLKKSSAGSSRYLAREKMVKFMEEEVAKSGGTGNTVRLGVFRDPAKQPNGGAGGDGPQLLTPQRTVTAFDKEKLCMKTVDVLGPPPQVAAPPPPHPCHHRQRGLRLITPALHRWRRFPT